MRYQMDDVESEGLMKVWREFALAQISDCSPRDVAALFDLGKRLPGMFLKHHVGVFGKAAEFVEQQKQLHVAAIHAVTTRDLIAPFLTKDQLTDPLDGYAQFVGMPRVESEINYAYCSGLNIHPEALEFARIWINKIPSRWMKGASRTLYPLNAPLMLSPVQPQPTIGTNTRLTAVEAPVVQPVARAVEEPVLLPEPDADFDWKPEPVAARYSPPVEPANVVAPKRPKQPNFIDRVVASPTISRINFGGQRSGKTLSFAAASKILADAGWSIYHINLASYTNERGINEDDQYWLHATSVRADLSKLSPWEAAPIIERAEEVVTEFFSNPKSILIIDEIVTTGGKDHEHAASCEKLMASIADKISCLTSTGTKRMQAIWALSPDFVAGRLMDQVKSVKSLKVCMVVVPPDRFIAWEDGAGESVRIGFSSEAFTNVQRNFPSLTEPPRGTGCDRIAFIDGEWMEVGDVSFMFNQSKKSAKSTKATKPPCSTENQLQALASAGDVDGLESLKQALDKRVAANAEAMAPLKGRN
jgi:hypothetical protein